VDLAARGRKDRLLRKAPDGENDSVICRRRDQTATCGKPLSAARVHAPRCSIAQIRKSRLFEEAMRRYGLKYHVVGGFSFYERTEIKEHDLVLESHPESGRLGVAVARNYTPARGIGKTTIETIERLALETGLSLWGALGEAITRQLLPARALSAMKSLHELIEDGGAMLAGTIRGTHCKRVARSHQMAAKKVAPAPASRRAGAPRPLRRPSIPQKPTSIPATSASTSDQMPKTMRILTVAPPSRGLSGRRPA